MGHGFNWSALPDEVARILLTGTEGGAQLLQTAHAALATNKPLCSALGIDAVCAAWEADPLNPTLTRQALQLLQQTNASPELIRAVRQARDTCAPVSATLERLVARCEPDRVQAYVTEEAGKDGLNPAILSRVIPMLLETDETAWLLPLAENLPERVGPARLAVTADLCCMQKDFERAAALYETALAAMPSATIATRLAGCLKHLGREDEAMQRYREALALRPWSVNARLALHDLKHAVGAERSLPPGRTDILIYTYNKADDLAPCLESVFASDLGESRVTVLNNGSCDRTGTVLDSFSQRVGDRLSVVTLPVNIGAPAARNWLLRPEAIQGVDFAVFLDDDALVPQDWLALLGAAAKRYPEAGVWGCKVTDAHAPAHIQNADLNLRPPKPRGSEGSHLRTTDLHLQTLDAGQFDYMRPCVSVTGCCHLLDTTTLDHAPDFHIGFSPTQFDDLDRDLHRFRQGYCAVYTGHLQVGHLKRSGKAASIDARASGNGLGNRMKLEARHPVAEVSAMVQRQTRMLLDDLVAKSEEN